jgi:hypothetical protein
MGVLSAVVILIGLLAKDKNLGGIKFSRKRRGMRHPVSTRIFAKQEKS